MEEYTSRIADMLEVRYGSRMIIEDDHILFSAPKRALIATIFGNPQIYCNASALMQSAECEYRLWKMVKE